jgi:hypothetical protein
VAFLFEQLPTGCISNERRKRVNTSNAGLYNNACNRTDPIGEVHTFRIGERGKGTFRKNEIKKVVTGQLSSNNKRSRN